jgi:flagellin
MRINHNIAALNTYRQLSTNSVNGQKSLEKLSSGLRINKAGDDAAGLAISEKMRAQIRGLDQATRNAQDGISLIQTAEGALNETHSILQRMRELAVQSANDTNTEIDRTELQKEVDQLAEELTRIGNNTEFNTKTLLNGDLTVKFQVGANATQNISLSINDMRASALGVTGSNAAEVEQTATITSVDSKIGDGEYSIVKIEDYAGTALVDANIQDGAAAVTHLAVDTNGDAVMTSTDGGKTWYQMDATPANRDNFSFDGNVVEGGKITIGGTGTTATATVGITGHELKGGTYTVTDITNHSQFGSWTVGLADAEGNIVALGATDLAGTAGTASTSTYWVDIKDTSKSLLTTTENPALANGDTIKVTGKGIDISEQASADSAITKIQDAIQTVSAERSKLGAYQNRLEHTINNLGTSSENLTAAESRIRDVDMAKEMMEFTKNNILSQAAQAMLAQANAQPQGVLQLLR